MSILVVDDEAPVRTVVMAILEDTEYDVIGAANGRDAVACLRKDPGRFQLVLHERMGCAARDASTPHARVDTGGDYDSGCKCSSAGARSWRGWLSFQAARRR